MPSADPLAAPTPGQPSPFLTNFDTSDAVLEAVRGMPNRRGALRPTAPAGIDQKLPVPHTTVLVRNDTGGALPAFSVLKVGATVQDVDDRPHDIVRLPAVEGTTPTAAGDQFCVLLEPAPGFAADATLAAAGTDQGGAAAVAARRTRVTGADGVKGVVLPDDPANRSAWNDSAAALKVYPPPGGEIAGLGTNNPLTLAATRAADFTRSGSSWAYTLRGAGDAAVPAIVKGFAVVGVNVTNAAHTYAQPTPGVREYLTSAYSGPARLLAAASDTGVQNCAVLIDAIGMEGGDGSGAMAVRAGTLSGEPATDTYLTSAPLNDTATAETYLVRVAEEGADGGPFFSQVFYPAGTSGNDSYTYQLSHNSSNQLVSETTTVTFADTTHTTTNTNTQSQVVIEFPDSTYTTTLTNTSDTYVSQIDTATYTRTRTEAGETYVVAINGTTQTIDELSEAGGSVVRELRGTIDLREADDVLGLEGFGPGWQTTTYEHTAFNVASLTNQKTISIAARGVVHHAVIEVSEAFVGTGLGSISFELAYEGFGDEGDLITAVGGTSTGYGQWVQTNTQVLPHLGDIGGTFDFTLTATADVNLSNLTNGTVNVHLFVSDLP